MIDRAAKNKWSNIRLPFRDFDPYEGQTVVTFHLDNRSSQMIKGVEFTVTKVLQNQLIASKGFMNVPVVHGMLVTLILSKMLNFECASLELLGSFIYEAEKNSILMEQLIGSDRGEIGLGPWVPVVIGAPYHPLLHFPLTIDYLKIHLKCMIQRLEMTQFYQNGIDLTGPITGCHHNQLMIIYINITFGNNIMISTLSELLKN